MPSRYDYLRLSLEQFSVSNSMKLEEAIGCFKVHEMTLQVRDTSEEEQDLWAKILTKLSEDDVSQSSRGHDHGRSGGRGRGRE